MLKTVSPRFGEAFAFSYKRTNDQTQDLSLVSTFGTHPFTSFRTQLQDRLKQDGILSEDVGTYAYAHRMVINGRRENTMDKILQIEAQAQAKADYPEKEPKDQWLEGFVTSDREVRASKLLDNPDATLEIQYRQLPTPPGYAPEFEATNLDEVVTQIKSFIA